MVIKIRDFVNSLLLSLLISFVSILVTLFLQAPLLSLVLYGFLYQDFEIVVSNILTQSFVSSPANTDIIVIVIQVLLSFSFVTFVVLFFKKIISIFLKKEDYVKMLYVLLAIFVFILPTILVFVSIFCKIKLSILTSVVYSVFTLLFSAFIIICKKILPETSNYENRKFLFTEGDYEN